ncbi:MAG: conjugative transposon protein TraM, partial [Prevotella sp.]|nr:conjugative transposon protein TraM [Prevotella sp.]
DNLIKINLSIYDTDGLEGLYIPESSFRETAKDVGSQTMNTPPNFNTGTTIESAFVQWGMNAVQQGVQKTTQAISKNIKKNRVKLKYGTFVYLINSKEKKNNQNPQYYQQQQEQQQKQLQAFQNIIQNANR